jgi:hypothetical protein
LSWSAFYLENHVQEVRDVRLDGVGHFHAALQHAGCESRNPLGSRILVDHRDRSTVASVEELKASPPRISPNYDWDRPKVAAFDRLVRDEAVINFDLLSLLAFGAPSLASLDMNLSLSHWLTR